MICLGLCSTEKTNVSLLHQYNFPNIRSFLLASVWHGWHDMQGVRQNERFIPAWITNLRLSWRIFKGGGLRCLWSTMGNSWGCDALLTPMCGDAMGHWGFPLPGRWSCRAQHVKACIPIKFHQLIITIIIVTIFSSMRWEHCDTFKGPILEELSWERPRWVGKTQRSVLANQPSPTFGFIGCFCARSEVLSQSRWNWVNHKPVSWSSHLFSMDSVHTREYGSLYNSQAQNVHF